MFFYVTLYNLILFIIGIGFSHYSKYPDTTLGYKSQFARKNIDTWMEANNYSSKTLKLIAIISFTAESILCLFKNKLLSFLDISWLIIILSLISVFVFIFLTERHLRKLFNTNGNKKHLI